MASDVTFYGTHREIADVQQRGIFYKHQDYLCGACSQSTNGRLLSSFKREAGITVSICLCSCPKAEPTILFELGGTLLSQLPQACEFKIGDNWPEDLAALFGEAVKTFAAGAYTATALVCRKLLMLCACLEGAKENQNFLSYVNYLTDDILKYPKAKAAVDKIRDIGNEATHEIKFVPCEDARRVMQITNYLLTAIYSLPSA